MAGGGSDLLATVTWESCGGAAGGEVDPGVTGEINAASAGPDRTDSVCVDEGAAGLGSG